MAQVSEWLELKWWQLVVQALSATRSVGAARPFGGRVLRAAAEAAQRANERASSRQVQQALHAEYIAADLYSSYEHYTAQDGLSARSVWQRLSNNWTAVALIGWAFGLGIGLWLAGVLW